MSFYIGQKVVCVEGQPSRGLKEGETYIVKDTLSCSHGLALHVGIMSKKIEIWKCPKCFTVFEESNKQWHPSHKFVPLEDYEAMNELVKELTEPKLQEA